MASWFRPTRLSWTTRCASVPETPKLSLSILSVLSRSSPSGAEDPSLPDNPLPPCPEAPNCKRITRGYEAAPGTVYEAVQHALDELGPIELRLQPEERRASAVYRVALVFKDASVLVGVDAHENGSVLHVRSASRVGGHDLGVNRRRIDLLLQALHRQMSFE